jgi:hypothetical protein
MGPRPGQPSLRAPLQPARGPDARRAAQVAALGLALR